MSTTLTLTIIAIVFLLLLSGFFSGSETALTAAPRARIHKHARDGNRRAKKVESLIQNKEKLIGGILLGNNLVNILASALATSVFITLVGENGVFYATLVMTALVLIFAEVLPKTYAITNPVRTALAVGPLIGVMISIFGPVVNGVQTIVRGTLKLFGADIAKVRNVLSAHEEIRGAIQLHASEGGIIKAHSDMLGSILDLDSVVVEDIMVHRKNMLMINAAATDADIIAQVIRSPYTRMPVWKDNPENIIGILHAKDMLRCFRQDGSPPSKIDIKRIMLKPWFIPETTTLREQLNAFLKQNAHFALVVDEYGALQGLVTLEDIIEEIVGDITDEHDTLVEGVKPGKAGSYLVEGTVTIRDLNRRFAWDLPDDEASTLAGLIINEAEIIPDIGQKFSFFGFKFEILGRRRNQVTKIRVIPPKRQLREN